VVKTAVSMLVPLRTRVSESSTAPLGTIPLNAYAENITAETEGWETVRVSPTPSAVVTWAEQRVIRTPVVEPAPVPPLSASIA
jgi:hypothetical protein